jgi:hypothetical protein
MQTIRSIYTKTSNQMITNVECAGYVDPVSEEIHIDKSTIGRCSVLGNYNARIVFHTHPALCYIEFLRYIGVPSADDIVSLVVGYKLRNNEVSVVIAIEGAYVLELQKEFKSTLDTVKNLDYLFKFNNALRDYISVKKQVFENDKVPYKYMEFINSITLDISKPITPQNSTLFSLRFIPHADLVKNQG